MTPKSLFLTILNQAPPGSHKKPNAETKSDPPRTGREVHPEESSENYELTLDTIWPKKMRLSETAAKNSQDD